MTTDQPASVYLENTEGSSSKFYRVRMLETGAGEFELLAQWGRIGAENPQSGTKFTGSAAAAGAEMSKLADSKRRKGYVDAADPGNAL